jgi:hypothetical protein
LSHVSVHVHEGQIVPVVWDVGPAFCGYCGILSASFQAVYKHMQLKHSDEMVNHRVNVGMGRRRLRKWDGSTFLVERLLLDGNAPAICQPADSSPVSQDGRAALASDARSGKEGTTADNEGETCFPGTGPPASKRMKTWRGDENDAGGDNRHPRPEFRDAQKQGVIDSACFI